jgi:hypothetical protein
MLFGTDKNNTLYFDASRYIEAKGNREVHSVEDFKFKFDFWIQALSRAYHLSSNELFVMDEATGNLLMEESLSLLLVAYLDADFAVYMLERISEMLITGVVLSDTTLIRMANERITKEDLL